MVWQASSEWWSVVENVRCGVLRLLKRSLKDTCTLPVVGDSVLGVDERKVLVAWFGCILLRQLIYPFLTICETANALLSSKSSFSLLKRLACKNMAPNNKKPAVGGFFLITQRLTHQFSRNNGNNYRLNNAGHLANIGIWIRKSRIHALNAGNAAPRVNLFYHLGY